MTMSAQNSDPIVSPHQVVAAGAASAGAAGVTSSFGVAGTLIGAAVTAMIITGGSAILKAYLENATGSVKKMPDVFRSRANRRKAGRTPQAPSTLPDNPGLRDNFMGRLRASLGWFSRLPSTRRRSILVKGLIAALVAFVIGMGVVTATEKGLLGNTFACGFWGECSGGATPGYNGAATSTSGGVSTFGQITGGGGASEEQSPSAVDEQGIPSEQDTPSQGAETPSTPGSGASEEGQPVPEGETPLDPVPEEAPVEPAPGEEAPVEPVPEEPAAPETPPSGTEAPAQETPAQ